MLQAPKAAVGEPINTTVNMSPLVHAACKREDERFLADADDAEGISLSSRPPSPLTPLSSEDEFELDAEVPTPGPESRKKRKRALKKERRRKKRQERASAGHAPQTYAANPSLVAALTKDSEPIQLDVDASNLESSGGGAWVGKRVSGDGPWTPRQLDDLGFSEIVWDGV